ncbi:unnamed protein product [marine sediment metagenome]|uniref:Uncharacterized protein n=1 Tax=marine sediment metagenome TaxID=412755 RepID=X1RLV7_9ZZZZ
MQSVAYLVITYPEEIRCLMRNAQALRAQRNKLTRVLKQLGYDRGMDRWHYKGDQDDDYHPHQNALVDGGYLAPEELERQKDMIRRKLLPRSMAKLLGKDLEIHYQYTTSQKKIYHWLKYITRPTFLEYSWDPALAEDLYGFHNNHTWGRWDQPSKWQLNHRSRSIRIMSMVEQGLHPVSGKPITWDRKPTPLSFILAQGPTEIAPGYYLLPAFKHQHESRASPLSHLPSYLTDDQLTPKQLLRLWQIHQVEP